MDSNSLNQLLDEIISSSKYSGVSEEQKDTLKKKLVQKFMNDLNFVALQMLDSEKQKVFSQILATQNQNDIDLFIAQNIPDLQNLMDQTTQKYVGEVAIFLQ